MAKISTQLLDVFVKGETEYRLTNCEVQLVPGGPFIFVTGMTVRDPQLGVRPRSLGQPQICSLEQRYKLICLMYTRFLMPDGEYQQHREWIAAMASADANAMIDYWSKEPWIQYAPDEVYALLDLEAGTSMGKQWFRPSSAAASLIKFDAP